MTVWGRVIFLWWFCLTPLADSPQCTTYALLCDYTLRLDFDWLQYYSDFQHLNWLNRYRYAANSFLETRNRSSWMGCSSWKESFSTPIEANALKFERLESEFRLARLAVQSEWATGSATSREQSQRRFGYMQNSHVRKPLNPNHFVSHVDISAQKAGLYYAFTSNICTVHVCRYTTL